MIRYQAYAWDGNKYLPMSVPIYETEKEAIDAAIDMIGDFRNDSIIRSIRLHWRKKPIIAKPKEVQRK